MKLTLEVYSTSAGDSGGAPSFGVRIRDRSALEAGALYDPLDVNFIVDNEFLPAPETVAVSIYRPSEGGEDALVATTAGSVFAPVPGHPVMYRGVLATATPGFDSWYEETKCPDGDHTYPVPVFSVLEVRWSCGAEDYVARAEAVSTILTPIGVRAVKGLDGIDGEDGKAPEVDVADHGDGTYTMTVTSPDGTSQTVEWRDGRDGDGTDFPVPVSPADATKDDQYADALAVQGLLDSLRKDLSGVTARLDALDSLTGVEYLESIRESLLAKVDKRDGYDLVSAEYISVLEDFIGTFGEFGDLAGLDKITFNELGTDLAGRFKALESAVESLPPPDDGGTLNDGYVKFLDTVVASGDDSAQRILDAVGLVLAESNDAGTGIWKAVNANAKGLAELEAKVGSGGSSSIPAELEAMIRNSVQKDALGRGFSSNDFTQDYIDRINNSVQKEAGKGLSTVDFTMERAARLDALYNSSSTLNPPVRPDENAKEGQPADAKATYEALTAGVSPTTANAPYGTQWDEFNMFTVGDVTGYRCQLQSTPTVRASTQYPGMFHLAGVVFELALTGYYARPSLKPGVYTLDGEATAYSDDPNVKDLAWEFTMKIQDDVSDNVTHNVPFKITGRRSLYIYKDDPYVTKTYVDDKIADEIGKIEIPEPVVPDVTLPNIIDCEALQAANSVTVGSRSSAGTLGQSSFSSGRGNIASGDHSHAEGDSVIARGLNSHAEGCTTEAKGNCSHAEGKYTEASGAYSHAAGYKAKAQQHAYAWSGVESDTVYESNGDGTFNINPANGIEGFFIGQKNLKTIISEETSVPDLSGYAKKTDLDPITRGIESLESTQRAFLDGSNKVALAQGLYHALTGAEVSAVEILDGLDAKRDKTDNIAAKDDTFAEFKAWCDVPEIQSVLDSCNITFELYEEDVGGYRELYARGLPTQEIPGYGSLATDSIGTFIRPGIDTLVEMGPGWTKEGTSVWIPLYAKQLTQLCTKSGEPYTTPSGVQDLTKSYTRLADKPKISGVELSGDRSLDDLGARHKDDNIATSDWYSFTEWVCEPAVASGESETGRVSGRVNIRYNEPTSEWEIYIDDHRIPAQSRQGAGLTELHWTGGGSQSMLDVDLTATRKKTFVTKAGEPYVTPTYVKSEAESVVSGIGQLNKVTPTVITDATDQIKSVEPVNGKANWAEGVVSFIKSEAKRASYSVLLPLGQEYSDSNYENTVWLDYGTLVLTANNSKIISYTPPSRGDDGELKLEVTADVSGPSGSVAGHPDWYIGSFWMEATSGATITIYGVSIESGPVPNGLEDLETTNFTFSAAEWHGEQQYSAPDSFTGPDGIEYSTITYEDRNCSGAHYRAEDPEYYTPRVDLPPLGTRNFSLALATDVSEETPVTWRGAEVIEAFPGASKLAVGTTVWDVKEVLPGKLLVNRVPAASGGSVTLTSESGSNYELTVNNDGELEVKEA